MLFGITTWHIRLLCEPEFQGGAGKSLKEVAQLTPDQVYFLLCDREYLRKGTGHVKQMPAANVSALADEEGFIKGRLADGRTVKGRLRGPRGESYAAMVRRRVEEQEKQKQKKKRRRK